MEYLPIIASEPPSHSQGYKLELIDSTDSVIMAKRLVTKQPVIVPVNQTGGSEDAESAE